MEKYENCSILRSGVGGKNTRYQNPDIRVFSACPSSSDAIFIA
jgi:hypothetical protein